MDDVLIVFIVLVAISFLLWAFLETHYFIQIVIAMIRARYFKKKVGILDETTYYGICSTTDIDVFFNHMNNTRYLREVDFARSDFYLRTRLYGKVLEKKGKVVVGANEVIYRRPIRPLAAYRVTSKIVFWDKKSIFMQHHFITTRDALVRATVLSQQRFIKCDVDDIFRELHGLEAPFEKPKQPPEVARLMESIRNNAKRTHYEIGDTCKTPQRNMESTIATIENLSAKNEYSPNQAFEVRKLSDADYVHRC